MTRAGVLAFLLAMPWSAATVASSGEHLTLSALRETLPRYWKEYAANMRSFEGAVESRTVHAAHLRPDPKHRVQELRLRIVGNYPMVLVETELDSMSRVAYGVNLDYYFRLSQEDGSLWMLMDLEPVRTSVSPADLFLLDTNDPDRERYPAASHPGRLIDREVLPGLFAVDRWLPNLLAAPDFRLLAARAENLDGQRLVRLAFSAGAGGEQSSLPGHIDEGVLYLLPDQYWQISHGEMVFEFPGGERARAVWTNEYASRDSMPVVVFSEMTVYGIAQEERLNYVRTTTFDLQRTRDTSPERFRLSAYGLPEPDFATGGRSATRLVLAALTLLILLISSLYAIRRGTSRRNPQPEAEG